MPAKNQNEANVSPRPPTTILLRMLLALVFCGLPALLLPGVHDQIAGAFGAIDVKNPYFGDAVGLSTLLLLALAFMGSLVLFLAPGLVLALLLGSPASPSGWLLSGFPLALGLHALVFQGLQAFGFGANSSLSVVAISTSLTGAFWTVLALRVRRKPEALPDVLRRPSVGHFAVFLIAPAMVLLALLPKFVWESFNGDGIHAFEASRLLLHQTLPFFDARAGEVAVFPGISDCAFTFQNAFYLRLIGPFEAAVRIPALLDFAMLQVALIALAEAGQRKKASRVTHLLAWMSSLSILLLLGFSATYDPYCSDFALPATQDLLLTVAVIGALVGFCERNFRKTAGFAILSVLSSPAGLMLLALFGGARILVARPVEFRRLLGFALAVFLALIVVGAIPPILSRLSLPLPGSEHDFRALIRRFRWVQLTDFNRFLWVLIPCGIYPALQIFRWKRHERECRVLFAFALLAFGVYYAMAFVALHYFVPAMALFSAAALRAESPARSGVRVALDGVSMALAALAIFLCLPVTTSIYTATRDVGRTLDSREVRGYETMQPESFKTMELLSSAFAKDWNEDVPEMLYGGAPLAWNYYGRRDSESQKNYVFSPVSKPLPGMKEAARSASFVLHIKDERVHDFHRTLQPIGSAGRDFFVVERDILHRRHEALKRAGVIDLRQLLASLGLVEPER